MSSTASDTRKDAPVSGTGAPKRLNLFERYLTLWVALCMVAGVLLGRFAPGLTASLRTLEFGRNSQSSPSRPTTSRAAGSSGAALATVVGVLVEVPVMLSVCSFCNRTKHWFPASAPSAGTERASA
jgi:ACR3 family arsenite efflux pump ArsB